MPDNCRERIIESQNNRAKGTTFFLSAKRNGRLINEIDKIWKDVKVLNQDRESIVEVKTDQQNKPRKKFSVDFSRCKNLNCSMPESFRYHC